MDIIWCDSIIMEKTTEEMAQEGAATRMERQEVAQALVKRAEVVMEEVGMEDERVGVEREVGEWQTDKIPHD